MGRTRLPLLAVITIALALPAPRLRAETYVSALTHPLGLIQDPSDSAIQYVPQQEGVIRVTQNGVLLATQFLDLSGSISTGGEHGLLGLAFPRNYGTSGRFYLDFTNPSGAVTGTILGTMALNARR